MELIENMKKCSCCGEIKALGKFSFLKREGRHANKCKDCKNARTRELWKDRKERIETHAIKAENIKKGFQNCRICKKDKLLDEFYFRKDNETYRTECIECLKVVKREYHTENKEVNNAKRNAKNAENPQKNRARVKKWRKENPEKRKKSRKRYQEKHKDKLAVKVGIWRKKNPEKVKESKIKQRKRPEVKIIDNLRRRLKIALKNEEKRGSAVKMIGCTGTELRQHLEKQFYPNPETGEKMSWKNYGFYGWHIDHIIPFSDFDLTDLEQLKKANHYTNLQPLWAKENLQKSDKTDWKKK